MTKKLIAISAIVAAMLVAAVPNSERIAIGDRIQIHCRKEDVRVCDSTETP